MSLSQVLGLVAIIASLVAGSCPGECRVENCKDPIKIRWGKYCGSSVGDCAGQDPCDAVDECCRNQHQCFASFGTHEPRCYEAIQHCLNDAAASDKLLFSNECPKEEVLSNMLKGTELAMHIAEHLSGRSGLEGEERMEAIEKKRDEILSRDEL